MIRNLTLSAAVCALVGMIAMAEDAPKDGLKSKKVVTGLVNPSGIAIHSGGDIFIASKTGIDRLVPTSPGKVMPEVTGYPTDIYGKGPMYDIGPLGVGFLGDTDLVVADGSQKDGKEVVQLFKVGKKAPSKPAKASDADQTLGPVIGEFSPKGEGNFYGVAISKEAIYITSNGDDTKGWILRSELTNGRPGELKPFIATKTLVNVDAPVAITLDKKGQLVVGQMGEMTVAGDSLLSVYSTDGKLVSNHKTGLNDIAGLAFSPKSGALYAVDFAWVDTKKGGLFRLEVSGEEVKAVKVASLDKPTALAFDKEGNLYVTCFGTSADKKPSGTVEMFKADDLK